MRTTTRLYLVVGLLFVFALGNSAFAAERLGNALERNSKKQEFPIVVYLLASEHALQRMLNTESIFLESGKYMYPVLRKQLRNLYPKGVYCPLYLGYFVIEKDYTVRYVNKTPMFDIVSALTFMLEPQPLKDADSWVFAYHVDPKQKFSAPGHSVMGAYLFVKDRLQEFGDISFVTFGIQPNDTFIPVLNSSTFIPYETLLQKPYIPDQKKYWMTYRTTEQKPADWPPTLPVYRVINAPFPMTPGSENWGYYNRYGCFFVPDLETDRK